MQKLSGEAQAQTLTDDSHHGVEVSNVEALPGHIDEELQHAGPVLFLQDLKGGQWPQCEPHEGSSLLPPIPEGHQVGISPGPTELPNPGKGDAGRLQKQEMQLWYL